MEENYLWRQQPRFLINIILLYINIFFVQYYFL
jgi:hypothetical protein